MSAGACLLRPDQLAAFDTVQTADPAELDTRSRISGRLPPSGQVYRYRLRERALLRTRFDAPIFTMAIRNAGAITVSYADSRFATEVGIDGEEGALFCITLPLQGELTMVRDGVTTTGTPARGLAFRPGPRTRLLMSDASTRANVFFKTEAVEQALEHMLDMRLRRPLVFTPGLDWSGGLQASLRQQLDLVLAEFQRQDGITANPVALAATTDLLLALLLRGVRHSHTDLLDATGAVAVPAYVRRAEDFMRASSDEPIRIAQVALAAGCSVRTLNGVFQRFRGTTPLAALRAIRLEKIRDALLRGADGLAAAALSQRHGFSNLSRFSAAYRRRFGESPAETVRRASRV